MDLLRRLWLLSAYILFPLLVLEIVTGFGLLPETRAILHRATGGLLDRGTSFDLHIGLTIPLTIVFLAHATLSIRYRMRPGHPRWWEGLLVATSVLLFATILFLFLKIGGTPLGP